MRGLFITFEGIDGSGKSTQISRLRDYLVDKGHRVVLTREPGGTSIGEKIRELLLDRESSGMHPLTELFLYFASRAQHASEFIIPLLEQGVTVISDRFHDSSVAYQGGGRKLGIETVEDLRKLATLGLEPDITFYLDIDPTVARERMGNRMFDRLEAEKLGFYRRIRNAYSELLKIYPGRIKLIDASGTPDDVWKRIEQQIEHLWKDRRSR